MKLRLLSLMLVLGQASCTEFQYLTVSSVNVPKTPRRNLVAENDTVRIQYNFSNYKGSMDITVFNKLTQPIEINWKKSAFIIDGKAYSYYNPNASFSGSIRNDSTGGLLSSGSGSYFAGVSGIIYNNEPGQFIPPSSSIIKKPIALPLETANLLLDSPSTKESIRVADEVFITYKKLVFDSEKSPLTFRSYLTFTTGSGATTKEFTLEHKFYISEVWKSSSAPDYFPAAQMQRGDRFSLHS